MPSDGMGRASADPKQDEHLVPHFDHIGNVLSQNLWTCDFLLDAMMSAEATGGGRPPAGVSKRRAVPAGTHCPQPWPSHLGHQEWWEHEKETHSLEGLSREKALGP